MTRTPLLTLLMLLLPLGTALAEAGEAPFQQKCVACHTIGEGDRVGPDLLGVTDIRDRDWLERWIREPDRMIAEKDPLALELLKQYNQIPMPNLGVGEEEAKALIAYMESQSALKADSAGAAVGSGEAAGPVLMGSTPKMAWILFLLLSAVVAGVFSFIVRSTRDTVPAIDIDAAYRIRRIFFVVAALIIGSLLVITLGRNPYPGAKEVADRIVYVTAKQFAFSYSNEPVTSDEDLGRVAALSPLELSSNELIEFRVTSLDVTHNFAIYDSKGRVVAQTQAMPGYVNRLRVRFPEEGSFSVLCLEYCGAAHHAMRSSFVVNSGVAAQ